MDYSTVPKNFAHCFNRQCKRADECLRYKVALATPPTRTTLLVINPVCMSPSGEDCTFFASSEQKTFARGMDHLFSPLPYEKALKIKKQMLSQWGPSAFYRLYRKETLFTPAQQKFVRELFLKQGITKPPQFDEYIEQYVW